MGWMALAIVWCLSQAPGGIPAASDLLPGLVAQARAYRSALPSLVCDESVISQEMKHDQVKRQTTGKGVFRLRRDLSDGGDFLELHKWQTVNDKAVSYVDSSQFPIFMRGAFANGLSVFFEQDQLSCFSYEVSEGDKDGKTWRIDVKKVPEMERTGSCKAIVKGLFGVVLVDRTTLHVIRMERRVPEKIAVDRQQPSFGAVDYGPVSVDGNTMWLPIGIEGIHPERDLRFYSQFSNFHLESGGGAAPLR